MSEPDELYAKTLAQMEMYRDRALDIAGRIGEDVRELSGVMMYMHRDIAWLRRQHDTNLREAPAVEQENG